jgi:integrase
MESIEVTNNNEVEVENKPQLTSEQLIPAQPAKTPQRRTGQVIEKIKNKKYLISAFRGRDTNGKNKYVSKVINGKKSEAEKELRKLLLELEYGTYIELSKITLDQFLNQYLAAKQNSVHQRTYSSYSELLQLYVRPTLGTVELQKLTPQMLRDLYNKMTGEMGLGSKTVRLTHAAIRGALNFAVEEQLLAVNPCNAVKKDLPRKEHKEMLAMDPEQAEKFVAASYQDKLGLIFRFALASGMRPEEYLGLQWKDIDWQNSTASVVRTLCWHRRNGGGWYWDQPKTKLSKRTIEMPAGIMQELTQHRQDQISLKPKGNTKTS